MKQLRPVALLALAALAGCSITSSDPPDQPANPSSSSSKLSAADAAKLAGGGFTPGLLTPANDTLTRPLPDDTHTDGPASPELDRDALAAAGPSACDYVCGTGVAVASISCAELGVAGVAACGFAGVAVCGAVCESKGPTSHCSTHSGGKACMNRDRFWWCDTAVDGNKVRARYVLEDLSEPGVAHTAWAPSKGCISVGYPTAGLVQKWQVCTENEGCSDWFYPNHQNASLEDYTPSGTPPSQTPPW